MTPHRALGVVAAVLVAAATALGNDVTAVKHAEPVPDAIAAPVKAMIAPAGATVNIGDARIDFWWVKSLDAKGQDWSGVPEGTLVGAMRTSAVFKDIRGRSVPPGVYLLRFALQPQNGDHLGVSPHREFLLATPAADDTSPTALGHDAAVELAAKTVKITHPAILSLDPPVSTEAPLSVIQNDSGHTSVVFEVATAGGAWKFGVILVGRIEA